MCKIPELIDTSAFRNCVDRKHVCDGMKDCPGGDDEEKCPVKRACTPEDKCEKQCITTFEGRKACACPLGFLINSDGHRYIQYNQYSF